VRITGSRDGRALVSGTVGGRPRLALFGDVALVGNVACELIRASPQGTTGASCAPALPSPRGLAASRKRLTSWQTAAP
jgi:hypothetical protein